MTKVLGIIVALAVLAGGWFLSGTRVPASDIPEKTGAAMEGQGEALDTARGVDTGVVMDTSGGSTKNGFSGKILAGDVSPLLDFTRIDYDKAVASDRLIVLYFYASWCPLCKAEFPKMQSAFDALSSDRVVGFRVNYNDGDTDSDEKNLAREFGIAYQHTKVFIQRGKRVLKSPETWDEARYATEIAEALNE